MNDTITLDRDARSAKRARAFITARLSGHERRVVDSATLMLSELVTNSVKHASGTVTVTVEVTDDGVRVDVKDRGPATVVLRSPSADDPTGRGLRIVADLSDEWGFLSDPTGNCVWFLIRLDRATSRRTDDEQQSPQEPAGHRPPSDMPDGGVTGHARRRGPGSRARPNHRGPGTGASRQNGGEPLHPPHAHASGQWGSSRARSSPCRATSLARPSLAHSASTSTPSQPAGMTTGRRAQDSSGPSPGSIPGNP